MQSYPGLQTLKLILRRLQLLIFGSLRRSIPVLRFRFRSCRGFDPPKSWFMGTCPMDRRLVLLPFLCLFSVWSFSTLVFSSEQLFYESFDETFQGRWSLSDKEDYKGVWKHAKSEGHEDYGLLVSEPARKYALVKEASEAIVTADGTVILQYEVRLQNGLECGGAYLKFLRTQEAGWKPQAFDNESPYSIMFGPDKCGATNKIHFIFNHKNPKTGEYVEHHLKYPPTVPYDKLTHVYTAVLEPNNDLRILVDGEEKKKANLLSAEHFEPPVIPPKEIPDPEDKKPEDWDERAKIPDPDAKKPDDWDEDAPMEILDLEAEKPEGWLDDEPEDVDDPEATKPEDWDDEEDGEWEAPKIPNPKCDEAPGCGEWKRPMKRNPDYKGKWYAPMIDNPNYKGIWKPREIPNPDYFELQKAQLEPIAAVGIEIWTMQDGILFDNILISRDEKLAEEYRVHKWKPKFTVEKEKEKQEEDSAVGGELSGHQKKVFDALYAVANLPFLGALKPKLLDLILEGEKKPNVTIGVVGAVLIVLLTIVYKLLFGGKKTKPVEKKQNAAPAAPTEKEDETVDAAAAAEKEKSGSENEIEGDNAAPRQRRPRRET